MTLIQNMWRESGVSVSSKLVEHMGEKTNELLAKILELTEDGIVTCDENHQIILFNTGAEKIFGRSGNDIIGKPLAVILSDEAYSIFTGYANGLDDLTKDNDISISRKIKKDINNFRNDGTPFVFEATLSKISFYNNRYYNLVVRDITTRKKYEETIQQQHLEILRYRKKRKAELLKEALQISQLRLDPRNN